MRGALGACALRYAELGYRVFPLVPRAKTPRVRNWRGEASTNPAKVSGWWSRFPDSNIGISTEGLLVLDVDGADNPWLRDLARLDSLLVARWCVTPSGGRHLYFRRPPNSGWKCTVGALAPNVDTRTDGGYVVAPPSVLEDDRAYAWVEGMDLDVGPERLPEPPEFLRDALDSTLKRAQSFEGGSDELRIIPEGTRNDELIRRAAFFRASGEPEAVVRAAVHAWNLNYCSPPLTEDEVDRIVESSRRYTANINLAGYSREYHLCSSNANSANSSDNSTIEPPPGMVSRVVEYTLETGIYADRTCSICGALALQSVLVSRMVADETGLRPNIYMVALANSGVGKDQARKTNQRILARVGAENMIGGMIASGEGIEDRLVQSPSVLYQIDEVDLLLTQSKRTDDPRYQGVLYTLLTLYSSSSSAYPIRSRANTPSSWIANPALVLFGTAIPHQFFSALSLRHASDGFLARLMVEIGATRAANTSAMDREVPDDITREVETWISRGRGSLTHLQSPSPLRIEEDDAARIACVEIRREIDEVHYRASRDREDLAGMSLWSRAYERVRKLAMLYACSESASAPHITREGVSWAWRTTERQILRVLEFMREYCGETEAEVRVKRAMREIRACAVGGLAPLPHVLRRLPYSLRESREVLALLAAQGRVSIRFEGEVEVVRIFP